MRRSLGKSIVWIVMLNVSLWGMDYQWSILKSPQSLRVGQSALVRYACTFEGSAAEYSIKLKPKESAEYTISILSEHDQVVHGKRVDTFDLLITPKKSGQFRVELDGVVEYVSPGSIGYTAHFGRENVSQKDIISTKTTLPSFVFESQPNNATMTGKMTMDVRTDSTKIRAYEPLHLSVIIKGSGNFDQFVPYELNISGVKIFSEPPQKFLTPSSEGETGEIHQEFALVADKSYVIPPLTLSLFDTLHNRQTVLKSEPIAVEINDGYDPASLLDIPDLSNYATLKRYALYAALVIFGMMLGEAARKLWKVRPRRKTKQFWDDAATPKELIMLLSFSGEKRFKPIINQLEEGKILLGEAKKKLGRLTTDKEEKR